LNYDTDPKPSVLVLGDWKHPSTKNNLVGGINLNYLSSGQLIKLRKLVDRLFKRGSLRSRYRYLKLQLPDVAMFYRTYDTKYIRQVERGEFDSYIKSKPSSKDMKVQTATDVDKAKHVSEPEKDEDRIDDLGRDAWQLKRRLYDPKKQRRRTSPERIGIDGSEDARKAKNARYIRDRKKLKELERQVEIAKELRKMDELEPDDYGPEYYLDDLGYEDNYDDLGKIKRPVRPREPEPEPEEDLGYDPGYHLDDLGYEGFTYSPDIGFIWDSADSYIRHHKPGSKLLAEAVNLLVVYDVLSDQFIIDSTSHAEILYDAGWDYDHTVLFEVMENELIVKSDCSDMTINEAVQKFKGSSVKRILLESRKKDPSYDPEHPEECCPHCGARLERGDNGNCNRCGKPWPEE
jgi:hypothetical protein